MVRQDVGTRRRRQHGEADRMTALGLAPEPCDREEGAPVKVNRYCVLGYFVPTYSKKPDAGIRHRPLFEKSRPSDRKLNTGPPLADQAQS